ncbi:unnamed protein product [Prorocentrum cordatum]|uniref:Polynucleotide adenylyltransferase n=1 Tax=Prorocentrum cordatum TaxID=2364126 RepID=A0ABN9SBA2_9DINO|nr:unnamed protein product [Polarella glacialis]
MQEDWQAVDPEGLLGPPAAFEGHVEGLDPEAAASEQREVVDEARFKPMAIFETLNHEGLRARMVEFQRLAASAAAVPRGRAALALACAAGRRPQRSGGAEGSGRAGLGEAYEPPRRAVSWLRPEDEALMDEDEERNAEQAARNLEVRRLLRRGRRQRQGSAEAEAAPEAFMAVTEAKGGAKPASSSSGQPPWFVARPGIDNVVLRLHEELLDFQEFMRHTDEEAQTRQEWVRTIGETCRSMWPSCQVRVFGSFYTGLSLPNGDVDVAVLDVPCKNTTAMKMLANALLARGQISWLELIESAKVPIVKVRSQASGLRADIVFNQPDGIATSKFVRKRLKEMPQMRPLAVFLKYFLLQRGLHETYTGGMGSYLFCNVLLHFMQRHPSLRNKRTYEATSLGHLLFDFFKYYGSEFNYDANGISVVDDGKVFNRAQRGWGTGGRKGGKGGKGGGKGGGVSLCLESPLVPGVDLGGACFRMSILKNLFLHGFHCLCHLFVHRAPADSSLLCPMLLDPAHPVIADRYRLMSEQPAALPGVPRSGSNLSLAASLEVPQDVVAEDRDCDGALQEHDSDVPVCVEDEEDFDLADHGGSQAAKRRRLRRTSPRAPRRVWEQPA